MATYGRRAGSSRVRLFDWVDYLSWSTCEVTYIDAASVNARSLLRRPRHTLRSELALRELAGSRPDRVILSRRASPISSGMIEARLLGSAEHSVYDFDDALWLSTRRMFSVADVWKRSVSAADLVIAGNESLANKARQYASEVIVVPSCVDTSQYHPKERHVFEVPVAGWIGTPSTEQYLSTIADPLLELHRATGLRLKVISAGRNSLGPLDRMTDRVEWHPSTYRRELSTVDFGIMPLIDSTWERGKCAYKLLQYGALGLPIVASPVGANELALTRTKGFAAANDEEWLASMRSLIEMPELERAELGSAARQGVEGHYSFAVWRDVWVQAVHGRSGSWRY